MKKIKLLTIGTLSFATLLVMAGCSKPESPVATPTPETTTEKSQSTQASSTTTEETTEASSTSESISLAEVISIYQTNYPDSDITSIDLDDSFNEWYYKVEGVNDTTEFELRINAATKEVVKEKEEKLDREDANGVKRNNDKLDLENLVPLEEITAVAEKEASAGTATDWELDRELTTTYWKVTVKDGNKETEVKIDAKTKAVLEVELDD